MKKSIAIAAASLLLAVISCKDNSKENTTEGTPLEANVKNAEWLIGEWGNLLPDGSFTEIWKKENDSVYKGESYFITGKDTLFAEYVTLGKVNNKIVYTVTVPGQNNEKPVSFNLTSITTNKLVFENPQHDYPNKIVYNKITKDSVVAVISGAKKGKQATETFAMRRLK